MTAETNWKKTSIVLLAIAGLTTMEVVALCHGINGTLYTVTIAAVAGLAGYILPQPTFVSDKLK